MTVTVTHHQEYKLAVAVAGYIQLAHSWRLMQRSVTARQSLQCAVVSRCLCYQQRRRSVTHTALHSASDATAGDGADRVGANVHHG